MKFSGIRWMPPDSLGITQLWLSGEKLKKIGTWLPAAGREKMQPLSVHGFNGRLTIVDGHSRAFAAWEAGWTEVSVLYQDNEMITGQVGRMLYEADLLWCSRFGLRSVSGLKNRILSAADYEKRWIVRCDRSYDLLTGLSPRQREERHIPGV